MHEMRTLPQSSLPGPLTPLIGREREIAAVCALIFRPEVRLVTLTGTGGVGKTRLALEVAVAASPAFADGICFVTLAPLIDPELVLSTIAQALGVREQGSRPLLESLHDHLREQQLLLLLDNFEQVVSAASVVAELLVAAPRLHVLVTSRTSLHLSGEHEFVVPPLELPDLRNLPPPDRLIQYGAIRLFVERAQAAHSAFVMTGENAHAIAAVCQQVDGLPLAIELAAGRSKLFSPQALLPRLANRLKLLVGGAQDLPLRQRTLRGTIAWSYDLLSQDEKILFRRLAVFVGGGTLEAAEAICTAHADLLIDVLEAVAALVDKSLLRQETQADGQPRLQMLETIREYALERLVASGEAETVRRQHASFFLRLAEEAEPQIRGAEQPLWRTRLEVEQDNLRAALGFTLEGQEAQMGLQLAGALLVFWRVSHQEREGRSWCEQVLALPGARARTAARAKALLAAGIMTILLGALPQAELLLEESIAIGREGGTAARRNLANTLAVLAFAALLQGDFGAARELAEEGVRLFREVGEAWGTALALNHFGRATLELGDPVAARPLLEESAALFRLVGARPHLAMPLSTLGLVALRQGDDAGARASCEETLSVAREAGDEYLIAEALARLGMVALHVGDFGQATALYQQSLALIWTLGAQEYIVEDLAGLAAAASLLGQPERAARLFGAVEALREVSGIRLALLPRADYDQAVEAIRAHLDDATLAQAWEQGRAMELSQAIAEALATQDEPPTATKFQQVNEEETSSVVPPGSPSSQPEGSLSPRRTLKQHFGVLTARELEVLRLLAQGRTSAQIAEQLVIGVVTVNFHVRSIYSKLGVSSRSAATRYAIEHQLV
jgi:predicted ATPase/DNA-binding NarL/FixJ family response regulator